MVTRRHLQVLLRQQLQALLGQTLLCDEERASMEADQNARER